MSWTDQKAVETIVKLRDDLKLSTFIETGTFKGINSLVYSPKFRFSMTCDINEDYLSIARNRLKDTNALIVKKDSPMFLKEIVHDYERCCSEENILFYLDAHFYDKDRFNKFVVLDELDSLNHFDCQIVIHDFDNGMGHIVYDGISLNMDLLKDKLLKVNPDFKFYTNKRCNIHTLDTLKDVGLDFQDARDNIKYAWSSPDKTERGLLYCLTKEIDLNKYNELRRL